MEFVFLKDELVVDPLDLGKVEVRLGYQNGGFRDVRLMQLVFEKRPGAKRRGYLWELKKHPIPNGLLCVPVDDIALYGGE